MRRLFFRKLASEKPREDVKHLHYYFSLGRVGEGYLITVILQRFEWRFFLKFWVTVSMNMFRMPLSADQIVIDSAEPRFNELSLNRLRQEYRDGLVESFQKEINTIKESKLSDFEKTAITQQLKKQLDKIKSIWGSFTQKETLLLSSFKQGGYEPLCKEEEGATTYYYMVKRLEGVLIINRIEVVRAGGKQHIMKVQQFDVNQVFAHAFKDAILRKENK